MGNMWLTMVEAKIRDWQRRVDAGEAPAPAEDTTPAVRPDSLEMALFKEALKLYEAARDAPDEKTRKAYLAEANSTRIQLMIVLEKDRPRLARTLEGKLVAALYGDKPVT